MRYNPKFHVPSVAKKYYYSTLAKQTKENVDTKELLYFP